MPADLSVVVPAVNTLGDVIGCLTALDAQTNAQVEVLVVDRLGDGVRAEVARRFPRARVIPVPRETTIPRMREIAFAGSRKARGIAQETMERVRDAVKLRY